MGILAEDKVHRLEVVRFLRHVGLCVLDLGRLGSYVQFGSGFLEALIVDVVGADVFVQVLVSERLGVIRGWLAVVLHQVRRNVSRVRLSHSEVSFR